MADDINKKITIDVEVNSDGQQQIDQYKTSFDNLRSTINNLGKPITDLSTSIKSFDDNLTKINASGSNVKETMTGLSQSFQFATPLIKALTSGVVTLEEALSGGLAILITFAPEIIKWVGNLFKADTTVKSLNQTLKAHKAAIDAVRQARLQGAQDALDEITRLKVLYKASQDHNLLLSERKKAVAQLQSQYPAYFGNLSQEAILAGKAAGQYKDLANSITAAAQARAAEDMMTDNSKRQLTDKFKTDDLQKQIEQYKYLSINRLCQLA